MAWNMHLLRIQKRVKYLVMAQNTTVKMMLMTIYSKHPYLVEQAQNQLQGKHVGHRNLGGNTRGPVENIGGVNGGQLHPQRQHLSHHSSTLVHLVHSQ